MAHLTDPDEAYEEARDNKAGFNDWPQDTWRSIEKDPPRIDQVVYATEGKGMWVGRVARGCEEPLIDGLCLENGHAVCVPLRTFTEWRPTPGYQPQKTAEQMFRELGYTEKRVHSEYGETTLSTGPRCHVQKRICYDRNLNFTKHMRISATCESNTFTKGEILACARLIEEMEAEK